MSRSRHLPVYVSLEEGAHIMSLSTRTIRRRISDGTIPSYQCGDPSASASTSSKPPYTASPPVESDTARAA